MNASRNQNAPLSEETCRQFAALVLLHRLVDEPGAYHAALLEGDDSLLEPIFDYMLGEDLISVGDDDHYQPTDKGREAYRKLLHQQQSYLNHFDVYAAVDLGEGAFGEPESDFLDDPRWSDLRVAVAEFKGVDASRVVFLSMLADGTFFENPDWKFDLVLGSSFFKELEAIVRSQLRGNDLGYEDEEGVLVSGTEVLEDVILQGARVSRERMERERERQQSLLDEEELDEDEENGYGRNGETVVYMPYDPWAPSAAYMGSALFVEALWLSAFW